MGTATSQEKVVRPFERDGWKLKQPASPLLLEDSRLLAYRHPAERRMLLIALATITLLLIVGILFRERDALLAVAAIYLSMLGTALQAKTYYRLQGAEVTATQFSEIYRIVEELRIRFRAPATRVFVLRKQSFRAEAIGLTAPFVIILPSVLIDAVELDELRYPLGQAFGSICFGHTRVAVLMGGEESALPAVLSWVAWIRDLIFSGYWRAAVTSADRAGVLACGDAGKAIRTQVKLSVGTRQLDHVTAEDLVEQAFKLNQGLTRFQARLIQWRSPLPPLIARLEAIIAWAGLSPRFSG